MESDRNVIDSDVNTVVIVNGAGDAADGIVDAADSGFDNGVIAADNEEFIIAIGTGVDNVDGKNDICVLGASVKSSVETFAVGTAVDNVDSGVMNVLLVLSAAVKSPVDTAVRTGVGNVASVGINEVVVLGTGVSSFVENAAGGSGVVDVIIFAVGF